MQIGIAIDFYNRLPTILFEPPHRKGQFCLKTIMKRLNKKCHNNKRELRTKKLHFMVSEEEFKLIDSYLKKYKIKNRSRWFRRLMIGHILKNYEENYPTLFNENEMRR